MLYRKFGKTEEMLSLLGFGAMRLPTINKDYGNIDYDLAVPMVRYAIDQGMNYLDTAWPYHEKHSEEFCAKVMEDGYRDKVKIATKSPVWDVKERADFDKFIDQQLVNLKVETIDFYLLHSLNKENWHNCLQADYKDFMDQAKASGKIQYAGFSFHDDIDLFKTIVDDYPWDFCQIQLNFMDESYQAGLEGMKYASEKGLGIIIMEPLRGGTLAKTELPQDLKAIWSKSDVERTPAEWALKYLWNKPEVGVVLSGMNEMWQVEENLRIASETPVGSLTDKEMGILSQAKGFFNERVVVHCTSCQYCMPCPYGVNIPECFWALNHDALFNDPDKADFWINNFLDPSQRPSNCVACGKCEEHCPQSIEIIKNLALVKDKYEKVI